ncbi:MAG: hypothetical protein JRJ85_05330 [Deltaproteobacteria bacterium]|nr:hypothetical protein [Deltaproteobacteria bacterium]
MPANIPAHDPAVVDFESLIGVLSEDLPRLQCRLDQEFVALASALRQVGEDARRKGIDSLFRSIATPAFTCERMEIKAGFRFTRHQGSASEVGIKLLNLGYDRKYRRSEYAENSLTVTVQRIPLPVK